MNDVEALVKVFDEHHQVENQHLRQVAEILTPTILTALFELFNVPSEDVVWESIHLIDSVLLINVDVTYNPSMELSPFLSAVGTAHAGENPVQVQKTIQVGIPIHRAFDDKDTLKEWLQEAALGKSGISAVPPHDAQLNDAPSTVQLSKEQLASVLYFQQMNRTKQ